MDWLDPQGYVRVRYRMLPDWKILYDPFVLHSSTVVFMEAAQLASLRDWHVRAFQISESWLHTEIIVESRHGKMYTSSSRS